MVGPRVAGQLRKHDAMSEQSTSDAWEEVLASLCRLQQVLPSAVVVGGTANAIYAAHRISMDHDHLLTDLRERLDAVLAELEAVVGWQTARIRRPNLILDSLDGIETGVRQLQRSQPLETTTMRVGQHDVRLPTLPEVLRIKAFLCLDRNATRDYLDLAALASHMGNDAAGAALASMDILYPQSNGDPWAVRTQLVKQLADPRPYDLDTLDLAEYKGVLPPFDRWSHVAEVCAALSDHLIHQFAAELSADPGAQATRADLDAWREARAARGCRPQSCRG